MSHKLFYPQPAKKWEEALPLGNGRIGAMVFGGIEIEQIALNDDTLWSGYPKDHNKDAAADYKLAQDYALAGDYPQAQKHIESKFLCHNSERYLPLGDLLLNFGYNHKAGTDYKRVLDLSTGVHTVSTGDHRRETFVSYPDQALVSRITGGNISFDARFTCQLPHKSVAGHNRLMLTGQTEEKGIFFRVDCDFEVIGGTVSSVFDRITVSNATEVVIKLATSTSYTDPLTPPAPNPLPAPGMPTMDYAQLKDRHIADHQALYNKVDINFGTSLDHLPTEDRLANWQQDTPDPGIFALLFQYGRYLTIAGSRPGTTPLNLQGIWNPHLYAPWSSNYTININLEMNYWPTEATNLSDCHKPLMEHLKYLQINGQKTAKKMYDAQGFTAHHNTDLWAMTTPVETTPGGARWAFWPLGAGWLCRHAFEHFEYSQDMAFLQNTAYPIIKSAAEFFLDVLVPDPTSEAGHLIFAPSTSPENDFSVDGKAYALSKTATMTTAIIKETLTNALTCGQLLDTDPDFQKTLADTIAKLPQYQIGSRGQLLEWSEDLPEHEPTHRHTSHLYPLFPGREIEAGTALAAACKTTLDLRGPESTGWALAWRICLYARLGETDLAYQFLQKQIRPCLDAMGGCYPNMFGSHPPFQIDSNFGATAGICEMLLGSATADTLHLLPALPQALGDGYVRGLRAKGGITVDIHFQAGQLKKADIMLDKHLSARDITIKYGTTQQAVTLQPGENHTVLPPQ